MLPEPCQRVGIETAIFEKLSADLVLARRRGLRVDSLQIRSHGHAAVLHAVEFVVVKIWRDDGQYTLHSPATLLRGMVVIAPGDGQEIDNAVSDREERTSRKFVGQLR